MCCPLFEAFNENRSVPCLTTSQICLRRKLLNRSAAMFGFRLVYVVLYSAEREESTFLIFSVFSSYLCHTICYGQKQHMTLILNLSWCSHMTICDNHVTLPTVKKRYLEKSVRLISPEGLRVKNPNLIFIILAYRTTLDTEKISPLPHGSLVTSEIAIS